MQRPLLFATAALATGVLTARAAFGAAAKTPLSQLLLDESEPKLRRLHPKVAELAREFITRAAAAGIPAMVVSGYRSHAEQDALYAKGRTAPGKKVTDAQGGESWHNYGLAFDTAIRSPATGQPSWPEDNTVWNHLGAIGESLGLSWGGHFGDRPHFSFHPNLTISQARNELQRTGSVTV